MPDKSLTLELITPERVALSQDADFVVLPAFEGEMGVLPGHAPFMVQLEAGEVRVTRGGEVKNLALSGGFAEVLNDKISIFAEAAELADEIDQERARQALEQAKAQAKTADPLTLAAAEAAVRREQVRLRVAELRKRPKPRPSK